MTPRTPSGRFHRSDDVSALLSLERGREPQDPLAANTKADPLLVSAASSSVTPIVRPDVDVIAAGPTLDPDWADALSLIGGSGEPSRTAPAGTPKRRPIVGGAA
jgi:hypothetical protein